MEGGAWSGTEGVDGNCGVGMWVAWVLVEILVVGGGAFMMGAW